MVTTAEWLEQIRARPPVEAPPKPPAKPKTGRPKGIRNPPRESKFPRPQPVEPGRRLAPSVVTWSDPYIEIPAPVEGLRHIHIPSGSMGEAAREGFARAREFWRWLDVRSVAAVEASGTGWKVSVRVVDDMNPLRRRRWRLDWHQ